jgi:cytochrome P450
VNFPGCRYHVADAMLGERGLGVHRLPPSPDPLWQMFQHWLINLEGERHARVRRLFAELFTPRRVEGYRAIIAQTAAELIGAVKQQGAMDLVGDFARPLPFSVIVSILGVPANRHRWLEDRMLMLGHGFAHQDEREYVIAANRAADEMLEYFSAALLERIAQPRGDFLSVLAAEGRPDSDQWKDIVANWVSSSRRVMRLLRASSPEACSSRSSIRITSRDCGPIRIS